MTIMLLLVVETETQKRETISLALPVYRNIWMTSLRGNELSRDSIVVCDSNIAHLVVVCPAGCILGVSQVSSAWNKMISNLRCLNMTYNNRGTSTFSGILRTTVMFRWWRQNEEINWSWICQEIGITCTYQSYWTVKPSAVLAGLQASS